MKTRLVRQITKLVIATTYNPAAQNNKNKTAQQKTTKDCHVASVKNSGSSQSKITLR
jgi:hypothetical protein